MGEGSALDHDYEEYRIVKVEGPTDDGWYTIHCGGFCFGVPPSSSTPAIGQVARFYGEGFGRPVRGLMLDGVPIFYRTATEQHDYEANQRAAARRKKQEEFEAGGRAKLDADYLALPEEFKRRIDRFRAYRTDFRWEMEPYEMSVCVDAVRIARALGSADAVRHFHGLSSWAEQVALVPGLFDGHSGNSFGMACRLAALFLNRPDLVDKEHGALCALTGCQEYGCWAASKEAKSAEAARG